MGVDSAYKAVMKPTEGTILTVARLSAAEARKALEADPAIEEAALWDVVAASAAEILKTTPDLLPVLKKAGVVDAGGRGLVIIYEGMAHTFHGGGILPESTREQPQELPDERNAAGEYEGEITFTYCTEFLVIKDKETANPLSLRAYLESIGDSVVVVDDEEIIKCHVHTDNPGNALQKGLESGQLTGLKIENMREQHATQKKSAQNSRAATKKFAYAPVDNDRPYGFVAVAAGEGVQALFADLGVDNVVSGGQTMNPSTDDILEAIHATPAKTVIVLPNNKNIIMAAEQTVNLADRQVYVLPTKTIPQGMSALLAFDAGLELAENQLAMVKAIEKVGSGQITFAARDSTYENHKIKKDEILALENNKLSFVEKDVAKAVLRLTRSLVKRDSAFITILYGEDVTAEQAAEVEQLLKAKLPDTVELNFLNGGQPVYYYIISVE
jgi:DAK2 domain fusion protein YloV